jgi:hypothetical protein
MRVEPLGVLELRGSEEEGAVELAEQRSRAEEALVDTVVPALPCVEARPEP